MTALQFYSFVLLGPPPWGVFPQRPPAPHSFPAHDIQDPEKKKLVQAAAVDNSKEDIREEKKNIF